MNSGTGPGAFTPDGCAVELYTLLTSQNEPEIISSVTAPGGSILELGCGTGRVTHELVARGYRVTAVDNSREMLAHVRGAEVIEADIETLEAGRRFEAVVLGSYLIQAPLRSSRAALAATCLRHVKRGGVVLIERWPPGVLEDARVGPIREHDGVRISWLAIERDEKALTATIEYVHKSGTWTQTFTCAILRDEELLSELAEAGLEFVRWVDPKTHWLLGVPA